VVPALLRARGRWAVETVVLELVMEIVLNLSVRVTGGMDGRLGLLLTIESFEAAPEAILASGAEGEGGEGLESIDE
jgi:hypothetical protein